MSYKQLIEDRISKLNTIIANLVDCKGVHGSISEATASVQLSNRQRERATLKLILDLYTELQRHTVYPPKLSDENLSTLSRLVNVRSTVHLSELSPSPSTLTFTVSPGDTITGLFEKYQCTTLGCNPGTGCNKLHVTDEEFYSVLEHYCSEHNLYVNHLSGIIEQDVPHVHPTPQRSNPL